MECVWVPAPVQQWGSWVWELTEGHGAWSRGAGAQGPRGPSPRRPCLCVSHLVPLLCLRSHHDRQNSFLHPLTGQVPEENKLFDLKT